MEQIFHSKIEVEISYDSMKPPGFDFESRTSKAFLRYGVSIEFKDWGMKGISFFVPEQDIELSIELLEAGEEESEEFNFKVRIKECTIELDSLRPSSDICPERLELALKGIRLKPIKNQLEFEAEAIGTLVFPDNRE